MRRHAVIFSIILSTLFLSSAAQAYIGPGAGLSAIGSALALIGAVLLMIVGFVWYPVKRLMKRRKKQAPASSQSSREQDQPTDRRDGSEPPRETDDARRSRS